MEDGEDLRAIFEAACENAGWPSEGYSDGLAALHAYDRAQAEGRPFTLVLTDLLVPGSMGGRELARELRKRSASVQILAVTGYASEQGQASDDEPLFNHVLSKPFSIFELTQQMNELLGNPWKTE